MGLLDFITGDNKKKGSTSSQTQGSNQQGQNTTQGTNPIYPMPPVPPQQMNNNLPGAVPQGGMPMAKPISPQFQNNFNGQNFQVPTQQVPPHSPQQTNIPVNQSQLQAQPNPMLPNQQNEIPSWGEQTDEVKPEEVESIDDFQINDPNSFMNEYQNADPNNGNGTQEIDADSTDDFGEIDSSTQQDLMSDTDSSIDESVQEPESSKKNPEPATNNLGFDLPAIDFDALGKLPKYDAKTNTISNYDGSAYSKEEKVDDMAQDTSLDSTASEVNETQLEEYSLAQSTDLSSETTEPESESEIVTGNQSSVDLSENVVKNTAIPETNDQNDTFSQDTISEEAFVENDAMQNEDLNVVEQAPEVNTKVKKIFRKVALLGLAGTGIDQATGEAVKSMTKDLLKNNIDIMIDSRSGYGEHVLQASLAFGRKVTGVYLRPYLSNDFSNASKQLNENDSFSVLYSNYLDRLRHFAKDARLFVVFENSGIHNLSTFLVLWSVSKMYLGQNKPLILVGNNWNEKIGTLKQMFALTDEDMQAISVVENPKDVVNEIDKLNTKFAKKKDLVKVEKVVDRRIEGDEKDFIVY